MGVSPAQLHGGYWLACSGDEIFADKSSVVGSIGVISASFGFQEAINKLGIERRVYTTGKAKGSLDPFKPENENDIVMLKNVQNDIQNAFVELVTSRRGDRLIDNKDEIFTGAFWSGEQAVKLGLIDEIGELRSVLRLRFGKKVRIKFIGKKKGIINSLTQSFRISIINDFFIAIEDNYLWKRLGR